eukprot:maker-scaffold_5-snap-gene-12.59-mRNA-1 protein AED:0.24 eAED:0.24 QI:0/1/0.5/1/0/0/2/76/582
MNGSGSLFDDWGHKVKSFDTMELDIRKEAEARHQVLQSWQHDRISLRGMSLSYLIKFWKQVKNKRRHQDVEIITLKNGNPNESFLIIEKLRDDEVTVISKRGVQKVFKTKDVKVKKHRDWTMDELRNFCLAKVLPRYGSSSVLDSLLPEYVSQPFDCSYVIVPGDARFESVLESLVIHWKSLHPENSSTKRGQKTSPESGKNFFVWLSIFATSKAQAMDKQSELEDLCYTAVKLFRNRLIYIDNWKNPSIIQRAWCFLEIYGVVTSMKSFNFIYDAKTAERFYDVIDSSENDLFDVKISWSKFHSSITSESIFLRIDSFDPSNLKSSDPLVIIFVREYFKSLKNGLQSFTTVFKTSFCKKIASKLDQDIFQLFHKLAEDNSPPAQRVVGTTMFLNRVGIFMTKIDELDVAVSYFLKASEILNKSPQIDQNTARIKNMKAALKTNLSKAYLKHKNFEKAKGCLKAALDYVDDGDEDIVKKHIKLAYGEYQLAKGDFHLHKKNGEDPELALKYFRDSVNIFRNVVGECNPYLGSAYRKISSCFSQLKNKKAVKYWTKSENIFIELTGKKPEDLKLTSLGGLWED